MNSDLGKAIAPMPVEKLTADVKSYKCSSCIFLQNVRTPPFGFVLWSLQLLVPPTLLQSGG